MLVLSAAGIIVLALYVIGKPRVLALDLSMDPKDWTPSQKAAYQHYTVHGKMATQADKARDGALARAHRRETRAKVARHGSEGGSIPAKKGKHKKV